MRFGGVERLRFSVDQNIREVGLVALGSILFGLIFSWPLFGHLRQFGAFHDWDIFTSLAWDPYHTLLHFHQIPLWDPYKCGGIPAIGEPQSRIVSPFLFLYVIFGVVTGMHVEIIVHLAIAFAGGYVLGRAMGLRPLGAVTMAAVFPSTSWFYLHIAEGHQTFLAVAFFPWIAATFWLSIERNSWFLSILTGLLVALTFLMGVVYTVIWAGLIVLALAVGCALNLGSLRPIASSFIVAISGAGFAAIKLLPALEMYRKYPRLGLTGESNPWGLLPHLIFDRNQDILRQSPSSFGFQEYGAYISVAFGLLALVGVFGARLRSLPWIISGVLFLALYRGDTGLHSVWGWLRSVPLFGGLSGMRLPARSLIGFVFSVSVLAGLGAETFYSKGGYWGSISVVFLLAVGLADAWSVGPPNLKHIFTVVQPTIVKSQEFRQQASPGAKFNMTHTAQANMGVLACYEYTDISTHAKGYDEPGYMGEDYLLGRGNVQLADWSPNTLRFNVIALSPSVLIVNQNYDEGWRLVRGVGRLYSNDGLIAVALPAGHQHLVLTYLSNSFVIGAGISSLMLIITLILLLRAGRRFALVGQIKLPD